MERSEIIDILLVAADFATLEVDDQGVIQVANPAVRQLFGLQEGEIEKTKLAELIPDFANLEIPEFEPVAPRGGMDLMGDDQALVSDCPQLEYLASRQQTSGGYTFKTALTGQAEWVDVAVYKLEHGEKIVFAVIVTDISQRKRDEQEIKELNENLEQKVLERTSDLMERSEQVKNVVASCAQEFTHVNETYQAMKEKQMTLTEALESDLLAGIEGLSEDQTNSIKEVFQMNMVRAMELYSEDQITDQKFLLTIMSLNEILGNVVDGADNLKPGQLSGTNQDEVDDLLDSLGI